MATARRIREVFDLRLAELQLNLSQASLLAYVVEFGPATQTRIAHQLDLGRAATGVLVDQLQQRRAVERLPDPQDRRVWLVAATEAGSALCEQVSAVDRVLRQELRIGISREERQLLAALINRLQTNVDAARLNSLQAPPRTPPQPPPQASPRPSPQPAQKATSP